MIRETRVRFTYDTGPNDYWEYTDNAGTNRLDEPDAVGHGRIRQSSDTDTQTMEIRMPPDVDPVTYIRDGKLGTGTALSIIWVETDANGTVQPERSVWNGHVVSVKTGPGPAMIYAESVATYQNKSGLRRRYQHGCPWVLYGYGCGVLQVNHRYLRNVERVNGATVRLPANWNGAKQRSKYRNGHIKYTEPDSGVSIHRSIRDVSSRSINLDSEPVGLVAGAQIEVFPGCNHQRDDCHNLYGNIANFGGQPDIPTDNPYRILNPFQEK